MPLRPQPVYCQFSAECCRQPSPDRFKAVSSRQICMKQPNGLSPSDCADDGDEHRTCDKIIVMRLLVRCLPLLLLPCLLACTLNKARPATTFAGSTGGEGLENVFWKSVKAKDWVAIDRALASNFVGINPDGRFNAAAWFDHIKQLELTDYSIGNLQIQMNGNTFVVTYDVTMTGTIGGQPIPATPVHRMSVWQQQKAGWVLIAQTAI